jgi:hypothetical protein
LVGKQDNVERPGNSLAAGCYPGENDAFAKDMLHLIEAEV